MSERWTALAARIDALSLRERGFLFLSLVAVCVALADLAWLSPARLAHQRARQEFTATSAELTKLREALRDQADSPNPTKDLRDAIAAAKAQADEVDRAITMQQGPMRSAPSLQELLAHLLRKQPSLQLVQTASLPPDPLASGTGMVSAPQPGASAARGAAPVLRQGMQVTVAGPYADLVRFVQSLETALPELRWGTMRLAANSRPAELTLQVYLVSPQP